MRKYDLCLDALDHLITHYVILWIVDSPVEHYLVMNYTSIRSNSWKRSSGGRVPAIGVRSSSVSSGNERSSGERSRLDVPAVDFPGMDVQAWIFHSERFS